MAAFRVMLWRLRHDGASVREAADEAGSDLAAKTLPAATLVCGIPCIGRKTAALKVPCQLLHCASSASTRCMVSAVVMVRGRAGACELQNTL